MNLHPVYELTKVAIEIARRMVVRWYITLAAVVVSIVVVIGYARHVGPQYETTMKVIPAELVRDQSATSSSIGGAASLFGLSLGGGGSARLGLYLDLLQSPDVAQALIAKHHLDKTLFAGAIDPKTGAWLPTARRSREAFLDGLFGVAPPDRPTVQDLAGFLNGVILINVGKDPNIVEIKCRSPRRDFCASFLLMVHEATQGILNAAAFNAAKSLAAYLTQALPNVTSIDARAAMATALTNALKDMALASSNQPTVAAILEHPVDPVVPVFPNPDALLALAIFFGIIVGGFVTWFTWGLAVDRLWVEANDRIRALYARA
jgi:hypothetical protein